MSSHFRQQLTGRVEGAAVDRVDVEGKGIGTSMSKVKSQAWIVDELMLEPTYARLVTSRLQQ